MEIKGNLKGQISHFAKKENVFEKSLKKISVYKFRKKIHNLILDIAGLSV